MIYGNKEGGIIKLEFKQFRLLGQEDVSFGSGQGGVRKQKGEKNQGG